MELGFLVTTLLPSPAELLLLPESPPHHILVPAPLSHAALNPLQPMMWSSALLPSLILLPMRGTYCGSSE